MPSIVECVPNFSEGRDRAVIDAERRATDLSQLLGSESVELYPAWETLPFERVSPSVETMGRRLEVLWRLRDPQRCPAVIVTGVRALFAPLIAFAVERHGQALHGQRIVELRRRLPLQPAIEPAAHDALVLHPPRRRAASPRRVPSTRASCGPRAGSRNRSAARRGRPRRADRRTRPSPRRRSSSPPRRGAGRSAGTPRRSGGGPRRTLPDRRGSRTATSTRPCR